MPIVGLLGLHHSYYLPANACSIASRLTFSPMPTVASTPLILTPHHRLLPHQLAVVRRLCSSMVSPRHALDRPTIVLTFTLALHDPDVPRAFSHHVVAPTLYAYTDHTTCTLHRVTPSLETEVSTPTALYLANPPFRDADHLAGSTLTQAGPPPRKRHAARSIARPPSPLSPPSVAVSMSIHFRLHPIHSSPRITSV